MTKTDDAGDPVRVGRSIYRDNVFSSASGRICSTWCAVARKLRPAIQCFRVAYGIL